MDKGKLMNTQNRGMGEEGRMIKLTADLYVRHYTVAYTGKGGTPSPQDYGNFTALFFGGQGAMGQKKGVERRGVPMGTKKGHIALVGWLGEGKGKCAVKFA